MRWLLAGAVLLASPALAGPGVNELSLGLGTFNYDSFLRPSDQFLALEIAYHRPAGTGGPWRTIRVGGGLRTATPMQKDPSFATAFPLEVFAQAELMAHIGPWEASAGPEVGVSGFAQLISRTFLPGTELFQKESAFMSPVYMALGAAPLRFHFGNFTVSALELHIGTGVFHPGSAIRLQLGFLNAGVQL